MATSALPTHNLSTPRTALIGREVDIATARATLRRPDVGILTLAGPGGIGKTRLALAIATALLPAYPDGVRLVDLAPLHDPVLVPAVVTAALDLRSTPLGTPTDTIIAALRDRQALLILDNCEHLIDAVADLAERLLDACTDLRLLATSREPLRLRSEVIQRVAPLPPPDPAEAEKLAQLGRNPAVALFLERARARWGDLALTAESAPAIAAICRRLDGIPLALELAAVRIGALPASELAARLHDALPLLTGGYRTAPDRQRTLRATLDWGYDLHSPAEQALFRTMAVFSGGWDLAAAEAVANKSEGQAPDILDYLVGLVDKSLIIADGEADGTRYRLLEPVRQYAAARLRDSGEEPIVRRRHAAHYAAFAERARPQLEGADEGEWLARLAAEENNLRAALATLRDERALEAGLRVCSALYLYWFARGRSIEGRRWLGEFLTLADQQGAPPIDAALLIDALLIAVELASDQGDVADYLAKGLRAVELAHAAGDEDRIARTLTLLAGAYYQRGDYTAARACASEAQERKWAHGAVREKRIAHYYLGLALAGEGDVSAALREMRTAIALAREAGDRGHVAMVLVSVAQVHVESGDLASAPAMLEESLAIASTIGAEVIAARTIAEIGRLAVARGDLTLARDHLARGLAGIWQARLLWATVICLEGVAAYAAAQGDHERALRLTGATGTQHRALGAARRPGWLARVAREIAPARAALGPAASDTAIAAGATLSLDAAVAEAEAALAATAPVVAWRPAPAPAGLSTREVEVLRLLAAGQSNREIADTLHLSVRTVERHIDNLYGKIDARGRAEATAFAFRHNLVPTTPS